MIISIILGRCCCAFSSINRCCMKCYLQYKMRLLGYPKLIHVDNPLFQNFVRSFVCPSICPFLLQRSGKIAIPYVESMQNICRAVKLAEWIIYDLCLFTGVLMKNCTLNFFEAERSVFGDKNSIL